jgi:hypothetical protein
MARMNTTSGLALAAAALLVLAAPPVLAQSAALGAATPLSSANQDNNRWREQKKPSALPGARGSQPAPAAAERAPADMAPNEALFDAVNRGDIAAARDALGRGADVESRNILGLTALELAIDLGRNDLTFLLLSMRGASSAPPPAAPAANRPAPRQAAAAPAPARIAAAPAPQAPRPRPANADPGTPVPQAGFLGFGPSR